MDTATKIKDFLAAGPYAVVGASTLREKFGNKVLRTYLQRGLEVHVVHPKEKVIEGLDTVPDIASLPDGVRGLSIITPPAITEKLVVEAAAKGIKRLWMQPGAESASAIAKAEALGLSVIAGGPCLLVSLGFRDTSV
ncbi:MAG TPA: CoA-binding protein [Planctomycetota bacterium]|nr:CoA-binding protein [Planctomycetota bacterium]